MKKIANILSKTPNIVVGIIFFIASILPIEMISHQSGINYYLLMVIALALLQIPVVGDLANIALTIWALCVYTPFPSMFFTVLFWIAIVAMAIRAIFFILIALGTIFGNSAS